MPTHIALHDLQHRLADDATIALIGVCDRSTRLSDLAMEIWPSWQRLQSG